MKKNKTSFLKENYSASLKFIRQSRNFIYAATAVFFGFALIAFFIPVPDYVRQEIIKILEEIIKKTEGMSRFELIRFIFFNNAQSSFLGLILGVFLGIFPLFFAAFNGYVLGFVALMAVEAGGAGVLWRILPHGIFELPAVFISLGFGLRTGMLIFQHGKLKSFKHYFYELARAFIFVVLPLLAIAAIIEGISIFLFK
ncbi:MAG: stage II sporulation protein M [Nanoarchaeota archaeon]